MHQYSTHQDPTGWDERGGQEPPLALVRGVRRIKPLCTLAPAVGRRYDGGHRLRSDAPLTREFNPGATQVVGGLACADLL